MKLPIITWAQVGLFVACGWVLYALAKLSDYEIPMTSTERFVWTLACITCPVLIAGVRFYWVPFVNTAAYALVGVIVEMLRRKLKRAN